MSSLWLLLVQPLLQRQNVLTSISLQGFLPTPPCRTQPFQGHLVRTIFLTTSDIGLDFDWANPEYKSSFSGAIPLMFWVSVLLHLLTFSSSLTFVILLLGAHFVPDATREVCNSLQVICGLIFTWFIIFLVLPGDSFDRRILLGRGAVMLKDLHL